MNFKEIVLSLPDLDICKRFNPGDLIVLGLDGDTAAKVALSIWEETSTTLFDRQSLEGLSPAEKAQKVQIAFPYHQTEALFEELWEEVALGFRPQKVTEQALKEKTKEVLSLCSLKARGGSSPSELSGGEWQKIVVARAAKRDPDLLVLVSPFVSLAPTGETMITELLRQRQKSDKATLILTTTFERDKARLSDLRFFSQDLRTVEESSTSLAYPDLPFQVPGAIKVRSLTFSRADHRVVQDLSFNAKPGEIFYILGENGAGKSTLLALLAGVLDPEDGTIVKSPNSRGSISFLPQNSALFFSEKNVLKQVRMALPRSWSYREKTEKTELMLHDFNLESYKSTSPFLCPPAVQRKLALLLITCSQSSIVLLDEPWEEVMSSELPFIVGVLQQWKKEGRCIMIAAHERQITKLVPGEKIILEKQ